jgi:ELWxxDGT repeat protein
MTARPIAPGLWGNGNYADASSFTSFNGALYFLASEQNYGTLELWKFDGESVVRAPGIEAGSLAIAPGMKVYDGALYFSASDDTTSGLWKYDGTHATLAAEFHDGEYASYPTGFEIHEGALYFGASGDQFGFQLWKYSSTTGVATRLTSNLTFGPSNLASLAGVLYFFASTSASDPMSLWSYDGVETKPVAPLLNGSTFFRFNGALYFGADDGLHGYELWKLEPDVPAGDLNRDGTVTIADFITLSSNFGKSNIGWSGGDVNYDNEVTIADFIKLSANFGQSNPQPAAAASQDVLANSPASKSKQERHVKRIRRHAHHRVTHRPARITLLRF